MSQDRRCHGESILAPNPTTRRDSGERRPPRPSSVPPRVSASHYTRYSLRRPPRLEGIRPPAGEHGRLIQGRTASFLGLFGNVVGAEAGRAIAARRKTTSGISMYFTAATLDDLMRRVLGKLVRSG